MAHIHHTYGSCKQAGSALIDVSGDSGIVKANVHVEGPSQYLIAFQKLSDGSFISFCPSTIGGVDQETLQADEDTGYNGNGSTVNFSGQSLDNPPIVPGTVLVQGLAPAPDLRDIYCDGVLYTVDSDLEVAGSINYITGALTLAYPSAAKAPGTGDIDCTYYEGTWVSGAIAQRLHEIAIRLRNGETLRLVGLSEESEGCLLETEVVILD